MGYFLQVLALIWLLDPASIPQTSASEPVRQDTRSIGFGVFDKDGASVSGLHQEQFDITVDSHHNEIVSLIPSARLPLRLGILIDSSNSSRNHLSNEKQAANFLAGQLIHTKDDRGFIISFDQVWDVIQDFTNDSTAMKAKINDIKAGGGTAMWDVLYFACRDKLLDRTVGAPVRRVIILLSDGNDNQSHVTREETLKIALRAGVTIYVIAPEAGRSEDALKKLAATTGGEAFFSDKPSQWSTAVNRTREDIQSQYLATFQSINTDSSNEFHDLTISVKDTALKIHAPKGYFTSKP